MDNDTREALADPTTAEYIYVEEGWWHPNVVSGKVHDHKAGQSVTIHRICEPVFTRRRAAN